MKKFWNHKITVGDYIIACLVSIAACVPYWLWLCNAFGLLDDWKEDIKYRFCKLKDKFIH